MKIPKTVKKILLFLDIIMVIIVFFYTIITVIAILSEIPEVPFNKRFISRETKIYGTGGRNDFEKLIQSVKTNLAQFDASFFKYGDILQEELPLACLVIYLKKNDANQFLIRDCELEFYLQPREYKGTAFNFHGLYTGILHVRCSYKNDTWYFFDRRFNEYCVASKYEYTSKKKITPPTFISLKHINTLIEKINTHLSTSVNKNTSECIIIIYGNKIEIAEILDKNNSSTGKVIEYSLSITDGKILF